jgi:hypothetical protein
MFHGLRAVIGIHARTMPLRRLDPYQRAIVKPDTELPRDLSGYDSRLIEPALLLSQVMKWDRNHHIAL